MKARERAIMILAGGKGERLWPLSRQSRPKQFLPLAEDASLLSKTIARVQSLVPPNNLYLICAAQQESLISNSVRNACATLLIEPIQRNTGPALIYGCLKLWEKNPDALVMFVPADHVIESTERFLYFAQHAYEFCANHDTILLFGVRPTHPAVGYGYIEPLSYTNLDEPVSVRSFKEKPSLEEAGEYVKAGLLWNSGIFCARVSVFIEQLRCHAPELIASVDNFLKTGSGYEQLPSISIDYALMEKSSKMSVVPVDFFWSDVGNLESFLSLTSVNESSSTVIQVNSAGNLIKVDHKIIALIGVKNLCIVDTGDALLIADRSDAEQVKVVLAELKQRGLFTYL